MVARLVTPAIVLVVLATGCTVEDRGFVDPRTVLDHTEEACKDLTFVSTGGSFPTDETTLVIRWAGYANFELVYHGQVLLLDAYFDRGSTYAPLGLAASDVTRVDAILIGHGHMDHMADAASIAGRTGAVVVGAPITVEVLREQGLDAAQTRIVTGLDDAELQFGNFTVQPILARHGVPPADVTGALRGALRSVTDPPTAEQEKELADVRGRGASGPDITDHGTIAYLITLDNGFRILYRDSGGRVTEQERAVGQRLGGVDILLAPTSAAYLNSMTAAQALEYVTTYQPDVFMPGHHDAPYSDLWRATEPIFQAIRDYDAGVTTVSKTYREPTCFDTSLSVAGG